MKRTRSTPTVKRAYWLLDSIEKKNKRPPKANRIDSVAASKQHKDIQRRFLTSQLIPVPNAPVGHVLPDLGTNSTL